MNRPLATANRTQLALQSYLDDLLQEAAVELSAAETVSISPDEFEQAVREEQARDARQKVAPVVARVPEQPAAPVLRVSPSEPPAVQAPVEVQAPVLCTQAASPPAVPNHLQRERPEWADAPFECLLFDVAGLTLAVPLVSLGSIYPLEGQELTPLFGQPDWFLGILPSQAGNLKVVDTARWVMPDRYRDEFRDNLQYVISVGGYEWGLAVHQVSRSIRIDPAEVKWRSQRTQRPWLAGTVIEHMCALLDVAALAELIESGATRNTQGAKIH